MTILSVLQTARQMRRGNRLKCNMKQEKAYALHRSYIHITTICQELLSRPNSNTLVLLSWTYFYSQELAESQIYPSPNCSRLRKGSCILVSVLYEEDISQCSGPNQLAAFQAVAQMIRFMISPDSATHCTPRATTQAFGILYSHTQKTKSHGE
jgi:hypothetical protein